MDKSLKVVSAFRFPEEAHKQLNEAAGSEVVFVSNEEALREHLPDAEVLCIFDVPANIQELAPKLRWLQFPGAGVDSLAVAGLLDEGSKIQITTAAGIHATNITEYVFGSMLMFNRSWPEMIHLQDRHLWPQSPGWYNLRNWELSGKTLGIVGLGSIGRRVAAVGRAFEMHVLGMRYSAKKGKHDPDVDQLYSPDQLTEMLGQCDYVVLAVPLTPQTEKLIGERELRAMRKDAYLINVARGKVIDEPVLIQALQEKWIAGAGLDVTETEPLPADSPLYALQNVILTPHISGGTIYYGERLATLFADNIRRFRSKKPLRNLYDPKRRY
jgi:phosphoglycerate dehydrogenase-like enzyme